MSRKKSGAANPAGSFRAGRILFGSMAGLMITLLLVFAASILIERELLQIESGGWLGPLIVALSAFFVAAVSAWHNGKKLLCGLLAALLYGLLLLIGGMLLFSSPMQAERLAVSVAALLIGAFLGVVLSGMRE